MYNMDSELLKYKTKDSTYLLQFGYNGEHFNGGSFFLLHRSVHNVWRVPWVLLLPGPTFA